MGRNNIKKLYYVRGFKENLRINNNSFVSVIDTDKKSVFILKKLCEDFGLKHAVISPGSRNAPITISFAKSEKIICISVSDERSAAFIALGIAQQTKEPVVHRSELEEIKFDTIWKRYNNHRFISISSFRIYLEDITEKK
jgi:hypothetical protein